MDQNFGSVIHNGQTYTLSQSPYLDNGIYKATAYDAKEDEYQICFNIIHPDYEDESEACDWNDFEIYHYAKGRVV